MGFREDIEVSDLIAALPKDVRAGFQGSAPKPSPIPSLISDDDEIYSTPNKLGGRVETCSTGMELMAWPSMCYDVNGYYHALGVGYRATRRQLLRAYSDKDGQNDPYLTYVFAQLLNEKIRREYDAMQPGEVFLDKYRLEQIRTKAFAKASQMRVLGVEVSAEELLDRWGFDFGAENAEEAVDTPQETGETEVAQAPGVISGIWPYAYFLWRLRFKDRQSDLTSMARRWQAALITECQTRKVSASFAVGLMRDEISRIAEMSVHGTRVVFIDISATEDMKDLATQAVNRLSP